MNTTRKLIGNTFIYGFATVLPRMMSFLLVPLYTDLLNVGVYGKVSIIFSWLVLFNIVLSYGMETAVFRFYHKEEGQKNRVLSTALGALLTSSLGFLILGLFTRDLLASALSLKAEYIVPALFILVLDALVVIPFARLRILQKAGLYTFIKLLNVGLNLLLNLAFLWYFPKMGIEQLAGIKLIFSDPVVAILTANLLASGLTLLLLLHYYRLLATRIDKNLLVDMLRYAYPVLIAGLAFAVNETFDRILLDWLLPENISAQAVGAYSACYKLAMFVTLFSTAFRLGIEPFFFSKAKDANAPETYATVTHYFVALGSWVIVGVIAFSEILKNLLIRDSAYWEAMKVVPILLFANLFLGIYHNLSVAYKVTDKTFVGALISVVGAVITLLLNFWLIPKFSYTGSAWATLAAYGCMMLLSLYWGKKYLPIPYHYWKTGSHLVLAVLVSGLSFYMWEKQTILKLMLFLGYTLFLFFSERKMLLRWIKR